jgi:hypothetical protein
LKIAEEIGLKMEMMTRDFKFTPTFKFHSKPIQQSEPDGFISKRVLSPPTKILLCLLLRQLGDRFQPLEQYLQVAVGALSIFVTPIPVSQNLDRGIAETNAHSLTYL